MALVPIFFARFTTGIFAIDMCIQSILAVLATGGLQFIGHLTHYIYEWFNQSGDCVIRVEHQYINYGSLYTNDTYLAVSWLVSRLAQKQQTGIFRMLPLDFSIQNFTKEMTPQPLSVEDSLKLIEMQEEARSMAANDPTAIIAEKFKTKYEQKS
ncbi:hypothetical protein HK096_001457 [Nowakowskiella sp. JEL0078]|nr:hypothetical protein HK096_001457 [Nowakowskiella sp. JEL0078]